ncbi:hypothetical protein C8F01DRAFT_1094901 [Mycena amicta]|nr:hypothetical protein C8F01DRAFT_1094901 [Mycena amicta]
MPERKSLSPLWIQTDSPLGTLSDIEADSRSQHSDSSYSPSVLEISSSDEDQSPPVDPNVLELLSDDGRDSEDEIPGSKANPIFVASTPSPAKKHPKRPWGRPDSPESPSPHPSRKTRCIVSLGRPENGPPEEDGAAEARALRILNANLRVETNRACLIAMARSGLEAMKSNLIVLPDAATANPRRRPGQSSETVKYLTVAEEVQMREWELYQMLRTSFVTAALAVLNDLDPEAPYAVVRRRYTLYVDPFQQPPALADVDPNHKCAHQALVQSLVLFCVRSPAPQQVLAVSQRKQSCRALQRRPPWRRLELENEISLVYTGFADFTQVHYGWVDVRFPGARSAGSTST